MLDRAILSDQCSTSGTLAIIAFTFSAVRVSDSFANWVWQTITANKAEIFTLTHRCKENFIRGLAKVILQQKYTSLKK